MTHLARVVVVGLVCALAACAQADRATGGGEGEGEADGAAPTLGDGGTEADDAGSDPRDLETCGLLQTKVCGVDGSCEVDPACIAAGLLETYEAAGCAEALANERSFPPCAQKACDALVEKVCGLGGACETSNPACAPAQELQRRADATTPDPDAAPSCAQALTDETQFAPCS